MVLGLVETDNAVTLVRIVQDAPSKAATLRKGANTSKAAKPRKKTRKERKTSRLRDASF